MWRSYYYVADREKWILWTKGTFEEVLEDVYNRPGQSYTKVRLEKDFPDAEDT
jgi:hypothetical protein